MDDANPLNQIFARRWAIPILASLRGSGGCKFITLTSNLDGSRAALKSSLALLDTLGLVIPNPGHGHPMRPEYILTPRGSIVAEPANALVRSLDKASSLDLGLKKWSMPTLYAVGAGSERFNSIAQSLGSATDRALSLAINDLQTMSLLDRRLIDDRPPRAIYAITRRARGLVPCLNDLKQAMNRL